MFSNTTKYLILIGSISFVQDVWVNTGQAFEQCHIASPIEIFRDTLREGGLGPEMVLLPAGKFRMGDSEPVHWIFVDQIAMGRYEVTIREFRQFIESTGYHVEKSGCVGDKNKDGLLEWMEEADWQNPSFDQEDHHPVVCVNWNDAIAYTQWLSQQTGQIYRLPTEAEWEYAARAKTETTRYWGDNPDEACFYANIYDKTTYDELRHEGILHNCTDGYVYTAPVGIFQPNDFNLFDMLGNVWEWTCSKYEKQFNDKEKQCLDQKSANHVAIRGGGWCIPSGLVRSVLRAGVRPTENFRGVGIRLVKEITAIRDGIWKK